MSSGKYKVGESVELIDAVVINGQTILSGTAATVIEVLPREVVVRLGDQVTLRIPHDEVKFPGAKMGLR